MVLLWCCYWFSKYLSNCALYMGGFGEVSLDGGLLTLYGVALLFFIVLIVYILLVVQWNLYNADTIGTN